MKECVIKYHELKDLIVGREAEFYCKQKLSSKGFDLSKETLVIDEPYNHRMIYRQEEKEDFNLELQKLKDKYSNAKVENYLGLEVISVSKKDLEWLIERAENIETTLYELDILHKKVSPTEHSSIDSHFKRIIDILKNK